jgi:hypothetical protein
VNIATILGNILMNMRNIRVNMNLRNIFRFRRIPPLVSLLTVLTGLACGTVAIDYSADLRSPDEVTIVMEVSLTDAFVEMAADAENSFSPNNPSFRDWKTEILEDESDKYTVRLSNTFKGQDAADMLNPERAKGEDPLGLVMHEVDKGTYIEYRIEFPPESFTDTTLSDDDSGELGEAMQAAMAGMLRMDITLKVFGEIVETNAEQTVENEFTWHYNLVEFIEAGENHSLVPYVVTRVNKSSGSSGSCNRLRN